MLRSRFSHSRFPPFVTYRHNPPTHQSIRHIRVIVVGVIIALITIVIHHFQNLPHNFCRMSFRPLLTQGAVRSKLHQAKVKLAWSISLQLTNGFTDVTLVDKDAAN